MKKLSSEQISAFERDGFLIVRGFLDFDEAEILRRAAKADAAFQKNAYDLKDPEGGVAKLVLWNKAGEDLWGSLARCERLVHAMEQLLGDEVYHYHSKMSIKEPFTGGAWGWHQDYGYWYQNGCLFPDMASVMIAVDPNTRENGCLQLLRGSHKMGRVEHGRFGDQTGADPERVEHGMKVMDLVYAEMEPGDACFSTATRCTGPTRINRRIRDGRCSVVTTRNTITPTRHHIIPSTNRWKSCPIRSSRTWARNYSAKAPSFGTRRTTQRSARENPEAVLLRRGRKVLCRC